VIVAANTIEVKACEQPLTTLFTSCREGLFSETGFPIRGVLGNSEAEGHKERAEAIKRPRPVAEEC
jgi:hypothetical protein